MIMKHWRIGAIMICLGVSQVHGMDMLRKFLPALPANKEGEKFVNAAHVLSCLHLNELNLIVDQKEEYLFNDYSLNIFPFMTAIAMGWAAGQHDYISLAIPLLTTAALIAGYSIYEKTETGLANRIVNCLMQLKEEQTQLQKIMSDTNQPHYIQNTKCIEACARNAEINDIFERIRRTLIQSNGVPGLSLLLYREQND